MKDIVDFLRVFLDCQSWNRNAVVNPDYLFYQRNPKVTMVVHYQIYGEELICLASGLNTNILADFIDSLVEHALPASIQTCSD